MRYDPEKWLSSMHKQLPILREVVPASCLSSSGILGTQARMLGALFMQKEQTAHFNIHQMILPYKTGRPNVTTLKDWWGYYQLKKGYGDSKTSSRTIFPNVDLVRLDIWGRGAKWWDKDATPTGWRQGRVAVWPRCPIFTKDHEEEFLIGAEEMGKRMGKGVLKGRVEEAAVFLLVNLFEKPYPGFLLDLCRRTANMGHLQWFLDLGGHTGRDEKIDGRHYIWASPWRTPERDSVISGTPYRGTCNPFVAIIPDVAIRRRLHQKLPADVRWSWARNLFYDVAVLQTVYDNMLDLPRMKNRELAQAVADMVRQDDIYRKATSVTPTGLHDFPVLLFDKKWEAQRRS